MTATPWGPSQSASQLAPGIMLYSTAGHGGIHLSKGRMAALPAHLHKRNAAYCPLDWFEEDCEVALVIAGFPEYFSAEQIAQATRTIDQYYPEKGRLSGEGADPAMTQIVYGVTVDMLPAHPDPGVQLYCAHCQQGYSATRGDYFWMTPGKPFRCQGCRRALQLVKERIVRERIQP